MNFDRLRFVAERAELGERREAILAVTIPERPGSFKRFCALIGARNVTEFNYRYADPAKAQVFVGLSIHNREETRDAGPTLADVTASRPRTSATTRWPSCTFGIWSAATPPGKATKWCTGSSSPSAPGR